MKRKKGLLVNPEPTRQTCRGPGGKTWVMIPRPKLCKSEGDSVSSQNSPHSVQFIDFRPQRMHCHILGALKCGAMACQNCCEKSSLTCPRWLGPTGREITHVETRLHARTSSSSRTAASRRESGHAQEKYR